MTWLSLMAVRLRAPFHADPITHEAITVRDKIGHGNGARVKC
jgi:hypothetical protein